MFIELLLPLYQCPTSQQAFLNTQMSWVPPSLSYPDQIQRLLTWTGLVRTARPEESSFLCTLHHVHVLKGKIFVI